MALRCIYIIYIFFTLFTLNFTCCFNFYNLLQTLYTYIEITNVNNLKYNLLLPKYKSYRPMTSKECVLSPLPVVRVFSLSMATTAISSVPGPGSNSGPLLRGYNQHKTQSSIYSPIWTILLILYLSTG